MLKKVLALCLSSLILVVMSSCVENEQYCINKSNYIFDINIPQANLEYYNNTHGGFHGDGDTVEIISLTKEQNEIFNSEIDSRWLSLDTKSEIYNVLWSSITKTGETPCGMLDEIIIPEKDMKFILYDDTSKTFNDEIDLKSLYNYYFVGYSYSKNKIYIQQTDI